MIEKFVKSMDTADFADFEKPRISKTEDFEKP